MLDAARLHSFVRKSGQGVFDAHLHWRGLRRIARHVNTEAQHRLAASQFCPAPPYCRTNSQEFSSPSLISDSASWRIGMDGKSAWAHIPRMTKRMHLSPLYREPDIKRAETPWVSI